MLIKFKLALNNMNDTWIVKLCKFMIDGEHITIDAKYIVAIGLPDTPRHLEGLLCIWTKLRDEKGIGIPLCLISKAENIEALEQWQAFLDTNKTSKVFPEIKKPNRPRGLYGN